MKMELNINQTHHNDTRYLEMTGVGPAATLRATQHQLTRYLEMTGVGPAATLRAKGLAMGTKRIHQDQSDSSSTSITGPITSILRSKKFAELFLKDFFFSKKILLRNFPFKRDHLNNVH
jgi:hypothetical protein